MNSLVGQCLLIDSAILAMLEAERSREVCGPGVWGRVRGQVSVCRPDKGGQVRSLPPQLATES